ncbi:hypothetical protein F909_01675 [Acinetobacter sp. ANC 3929]|uniref:DUF1345 domain-containing protein n=1 Tax=unclassified Acinetobacter TaxID=196816 RepID=UPI0002D12E50|nr:MULTISPECIES: DUF1345 domain-containing protein [unclassified Acinetobacter]ENW81986.1 hypothetical protein F909_01675 [Acinetobacter sp. ANC 3929]MCH7352678.1 DUF1345 domain-containing protein [Acinetobacter sp. NIPH 2023]MCH7356724.1 DUF1345 domain-containing protein [Acinetobacter sp. NIPH 1958]MCH7359996.1 DUF1345 domain-containing protein [Acinetobacter sp. NIPH 2024]
MQRFLQRLAREIKHRPYLSATFALGLVIYGLLHIFTRWQWATCLQLGWNIAIWLYLFLTLKMMWHLDATHILKRAQQQDEGKWMILIVVLIAIVVCFISIVVQLSHVPKDLPILKGVLILLTMGTIFSTWLLLHTLFAIHYAHDFYLAKSRHEEAGLEFPKTDQPDYLDFIYFSYIIGTSAQTADVSITSSSLRHLNIFHCVLAFIFNTVILAVAINVAASLIGLN